MLNIIFGDVTESIYNTEIYFANTYEDEWITSDIARKIIKDIDKSEVAGANCIISPVLGQITPLQLSGGTKTLILIYNETDQIFNASTCGDNCTKWILDIAREKDITINLRHLMDFGESEFTAKIVNNGKIICGMKELLPIANECLRKGVR